MVHIMVRYVPEREWECMAGKKMQEWQPQLDSLGLLQVYNIRQQITLL